MTMLPSKFSNATVDRVLVVEGGGGAGGRLRVAGQRTEAVSITRYAKILQKYN